MKIIVVGGGIGGLSTYIALRTHLPPDTTIKVFESHSSPQSTTVTVGGGLGLAPNGLRALASLSKQLVEDLQSRGFPRSILTFRNSTGVLLGHFWRGRKERYGFEQTMISRAAVHEVLLSYVPEEAISWGKKVRGVHETNEGVQVEFEDGKKEVADFVIGADGVKSAVRSAIFGGESYQPFYDGFTGIGGFLPVSSLPQGFRDSLTEEPIVMTFGAAGFFGFSLATKLEDPKCNIMWWSTYETTPPPPRDSSLADIRNHLLSQHSSWRSPRDEPDAPLFQTIISLACGSESDAGSDVAAVEKNVLILPRYQITGRLPRWSSSSGKIVLMGDAAHAMPPDGGQGVSCAAEDSVVLALTLKHFLGKSSAGDLTQEDAIRKAVAGYEELRMPRVGRIMDGAERRVKKKKIRSWWQERLRDWLLWLLCKLPESLGDRLNSYDAEKETEKYISGTEP
jgi:2-polyprenyl-6-methoxyphenol hydroxylase-like FAD-dependent oxidoreductase